MTRGLLRQLPSVNTLQQNPGLAEAIRVYGSERITPLIRQVVHTAREQLLRLSDAAHSDAAHRIASDFTEATLVAQVNEILRCHTTPSLKQVINATGIILHTNLGRAVLGAQVLNDIRPIIEGYSNLEYDLDTQTRGHRDSHLLPLLTLITGAEEAAVVNNNAAALILVLNTLAYGKEVIISRGELVEIGGSFRIPEILAASGAIMVEVGTTNKTHLHDYQNAITPNTAMILKAHKSNYDIVGFTDEVSLADLAQFSHAHGLPFVYDMGSGLIRKPNLAALNNEPDVRTALNVGVDIVTFSGDKLLGGAQAGILVGSKVYLKQLKKAPMMRALRVDKLTIAVLSSVMRAYLNDQTLFKTLPFYQTLLQTESTLKIRAERFKQALLEHNIPADIVSHLGRCGGGTLPTFEISSYAVRLLSGQTNQQGRSRFAEHLFRQLHHANPPVVGILRQADLLFDVLTLEDKHIPYLVQHIALIINQEGSHV